VILLTLAGLQFIGLVDFMIVMPLGPQLQADLGINAQQFGWIVSSYTLAAGIAGFCAAAWLDRVPRKVSYIVFSLGLLAGTAACGLATSYPVLLAARCLTGAFGGVHGAVALAIVADVFPTERRGHANSMLMLAFGVASVAGVPLGIAVGATFGWEVPFFLLAVAGLPLVGLAGWSLPHVPRHHDDAPQHPFARLLQTLSQPAHHRAFSLIGLMMIGGFAVIPYISVAFVANVGVTESQLATVYVAGGLLALVSTPLTGWAVDRFGGLRVFLCVSPLSALTMFVVTQLGAVGIGVAAAVTAVLMAANAGRMVAAMSLIMSSIEPRFRGSFMSANSAVQHVACGLGTALGGMILKGGTGEPLRNFGTVGMLAVGATIMSLWVALLLELGRSRRYGPGLPCCG
jgi:DHA1 family inner membrane transport protein